ncbi:MAG: prepilin peptidase, partial [Pseudorhodobacter sp.]|nr:prepilin peptidase [Pseudorhodobacter sp.]
METIHMQLRADILIDFIIGIWLLAITIIDLKTLRIPDILSLPLLVLGLVFAGFAAAPEFAGRLIGAGAGFLVLGLFGELFFRLRRREGLGLGDAKLFGAAGAWLGCQALPRVLLVGALGGLCWALLRRHQGELA